MRDIFLEKTAKTAIAQELSFVKELRTKYINEERSYFQFFVRMDIEGDEVFTNIHGMHDEIFTREGIASHIRENLEDTKSMHIDTVKNGNFNKEYLAKGFFHRLWWEYPETPYIDRNAVDLVVEGVEEMEGRKAWEWLQTNEAVVAYSETELETR